VVYKNMTNSIIAALAQRIPELEAPSELRRSSEMDSEGMINIPLIGPVASWSLP